MDISKKGYINFLYNVMKGGILEDINDPDIVDAYDEDILDEFTEEDDIVNEQRDEADEEIEEIIENEQMNETLEKDLVDLGIHGDMQGKVFEYSDFNENEFITIKSVDKNKILIINDINSFDIFTEKYGKMHKEDKKVHIQWSTVASHYKGIYIESSAIGSRDDIMPYKNKTTVENWLDYDYGFLDKVIIFVKPRKVAYYETIKKPFQGKVADQYSLDDDEFVQINAPVTHDKVLFIDDVKSFDKFTNRYGHLVMKKGKPRISIKWNKVKKDYDGIYIDKDADIYGRLKTTFYHDKKYTSWLKKTDITPGLVYLFS